MNKKTLFSSALIGSAVGASAVALGSKLLVDKYLSREGINKIIEGTRNLLPDDNAKLLTSNVEQSKGKIFYKKMPSCIITINNRRRQKIKALYFSNPNGKKQVAIFCHGFASSPYGSLSFAKRYYDMGYSVLMPFQRGHGESEHKYSSMGYFEGRDLADWAYYVDRTIPGVKIVLHGVSMGAATVMIALGEKLPESVICAIEDCGYTSAYEEYKSQVTKKLHLPAHPTLDFFRVAVEKIVGFDIKDASPKKALMKATVPTLFIHGDKDEFVPFYMHEVLYAYASCEKDVLVVSGAEHATASVVAPSLYWRKVKDFIAKYK